MEPPAKRLTLPATLESLTPFRDFVRGGAAGSGIPPEQIEKLDLVLEEILVNVARYAYSPAEGEVDVSYWQTGPAMLCVEVADSGRPFDPLQADPPDLSRGLSDRPIGGLGVFLIRALVDSIAYRHEGGRNILSFRFPAAC